MNEERDEEKPIPFADTEPELPVADQVLVDIALVLRALRELREHD